MNINLRNEITSLEDAENRYGMVKQILPEKAKALDMEKHSKSVSRLKEIEKTALESLESWKKGELGIVENFKNFLFKIFGKQPAIVKSAAAPYVFKDLTALEKKEVESKANFHRTVGKVFLIAAGVFMILGILGPFGLFPFLLTLPEATAATIIMSFTALGALGTVCVFPQMFLSNSQTVREEVALTDPDFKFFVERLVQNDKKLNLNMDKESLSDKHLHQAFMAWRDSVKDLFKEKRVEDLKREKDALVKIFNKN